MRVEEIIFMIIYVVGGISLGILGFAHKGYMALVLINPSMIKPLIDHFLEKGFIDSGQTELQPVYLFNDNTFLYQRNI